MEELDLVEVSGHYIGQLEAYRAEFPSGRMQATPDPDRIPGLDCLERFDSAVDWLSFCREMKGKITWYLSVRRSDGKVIGAVCFRHRLEYDDDDIEFASHIGYSVRPDERGKGYAKAQLRLALGKAREHGLTRVRLVYRDCNAGSNRTILACGGVPIGSVRGEESGMTVNRYDIPL